MSFKDCDPSNLVCIFKSILITFEESNIFGKVNKNWFKAKANMVRYGKQVTILGTLLSYFFHSFINDVTHLRGGDDIFCDYCTLSTYTDTVTMGK